MLQGMSRRGVLLGVLGVLMIGVVSGCAGAAAGTSLPLQQGGYPPANTITVSGFGEASGAPDIAYVSLGINVVNTDVSAAVNDANTTTQAIEGALKALGVAEQDIQTAGYNVWPEEQYDPATNMPTGERRFHVDSTLTITVRDLTQTGAVIEAGLNSGANSVSGLSFGIDDKTALETQARSAAIENARARAGELAQSIGKTLGEPIIIVEGYGQNPIVYSAGDRAVAEGLGGGAPPVNPGQLTVNVQVQVTFSAQ